MGRRPTRSRRKTGSSQKSLIGFVAGAVGFSIIAVGTYLYIDARSKHVTLDSETLCPSDGPTGVVAILIDTTDAFTPIQQRDIANNLAELRESLPVGYLFAGYTIDLGNSAVAIPAFYLCNPGRGEGVSELTANPRLIEERWREEFEEPIASTLETMTRSGGAEISPILEAIQSVSVSQFHDPTYGDVPKRLVIVSDMLQNSENYSVYETSLPFADFESKPEWARVRANLKGVRVEIVFVIRPEYSQLQTDSLLQFWLNVFAAEGTDIDRIIRVAGG